MAVFESLGKLNEWAAANKIELVDPGQPLLSYDPDRPERGYQQPPVRTVVDFIARHISSLPLKVFRRAEDDSRERVRSGAFAELIAEPWASPLPTMRFWYSLVADGLLADRMLAVYELRDGRGYLRRVPPGFWQIITGPMDSIVGVRVFDGEGEGVDIAVDEQPMILDVGYAFSGAKGTSQVRTLKKALAEYRESMEYRAAVNKKTARSPFAVLRDKPWPDSASRERFQRGMRAFVSGEGSAGSGMLLDDGMHIEKLDMFKPIDVADLEARDKVKVDVANAYGIPAEIMGLREGNFSNLDAYRQMLYGTYLRPYITAFEQALNGGLRSVRGAGEYVEFDLDAQMRGNPEAQYAAMSTATGRPFMTTNEIRARMNLPPVEGGDALVTPLNVLIGGQTSPQDGETAGRGATSTTGQEDASVQEDS